ncbi:MAG: hypothetical protein JSU57_02470 [Candidatus Heimdallarchaeota archaeon]|nr:MAG: hypothetical protein JSU57_02470 [Candidatus Heimdallarchaeota archaeon]
MVGWVEIFVLAVPLFLTASLSFLNFLVFFRNYRQKEEKTMLHIAITFFCSTLIFLLLFIAVLLPPSDQLHLFLITNVVVWSLFLEVGNSYLSAFLNRSREIEKYLLPIFGAAVGSAALVAIKPEIYLLTITLNIELLVYIVAIVAVLYIFIRAIVRINLVLDQFEGEELKLLELTQLIFFLGTCCIGFTFITCFSWLVVKGVSNLSLDVGTWELIDWVTFLNLPMYAGILLGALLRSFKIDFEQIDVPTILNVLDSPQE